MEFLRRYKPNEDRLIKIVHPSFFDFKSIGQVIEEDGSLNICKIKFKDIEGKTKNYWFHYFTGKIVSRPKKSGEFAKDVNFSEKKGYQLSGDRIFQHELDTLYNPIQKEETNENNESQDEKENKNITKIS